MIATLVNMLGLFYGHRKLRCSITHVRSTSAESWSAASLLDAVSGVGPGLPGLALCTPGLLHSRGAPGCALKAQLLFARE